jgi:hypothetical protein
MAAAVLLTIVTVALVLSTGLLVRRARRVDEDLRSLNTDLSDD